MSNLFWNREQARLRTLWRLAMLGVLFVLGLLAMGVVAGVLAAFWLVLEPGAAAQLAGDPARLAATLAGHPGVRAYSALGVLAVALVSVWLAGRFLDRRPFAGFGFHLSRSWWLDLGFGLALGGVLMAGIFLAEWALGWVSIAGVFRAPGRGWPLLPSLVVALLAFLAVGIYEELLSRGYALRNLAEGLNFRPLGPRGAVIAAWLLSSLGFGLLHAGNPNASLASTASLVLAGLFLGLGYVLTGELAIPIGLHISWNYFQGNVFGFPVSGGNAGASVVSVVQGGPVLWTGGAFGPEAGLVSVAAILVGAGLIVGWVRWRYARVGLAEGLAEPPVAGDSVTV
jgi:membrane protease YdiL (CAAX protease family)